MQKPSAVLLILLLGFSSCVKEVVQTVGILGTWKIDKYYENGTDKTTDFNALLVNYRLTFEANGNFTETATTLSIPLSVSGTWQIGSGSLKLTNGADNSVRNFALSGLNGQRMTLKEGSNKEYRLVKI